MPLDVTLFQIEAHHRSRIIVQAMARGINAQGDRAVIRPASLYRPSNGIVVFYGLVGALGKAIRRQQAEGGTAVYIDLGYWCRRQGGRWSGFHKVAVNSRHPTAYFRNRQHDEQRFRQLGVSLSEWKSGGKHILVAGMGDKGSIAEGFRPGEWETDAVAALQKVTDRPIIYRPKPSWKDPKPIEGTTFSPAKQRIDDVLQDCHAVVTHHSNAAVDGLMMGIPVFCLEGVASTMALSDLSRIEHPERPADRLGWAYDVAHCQFSIAEMMQGIAWKSLKDEGLLPC